NSNSRTVKAEGVSLETSELTVEVDSAKIAQAVWSNTSRTLTSGENIDFPEFNTSDLAKAEQVENVAKVSDLADLAKSADLKDLAKVSDLANVAKSTDLEDLAKVSDLADIVKVSDLTDVAKVSDLAGIAKSADVEAAKDAILAGCKTAEGFATSADVEAAKDAILAKCETPEGLATAADVEAAKDASLAECATAEGFATPADVKASEEVILAKLNTSLDVDLSDVAKKSDLADLAKKEDLAGLATSESVNAARNAILQKIDDLPKQETSGDGEVTVTVDPAEIANAVWSHTSRELTSYPDVSLDGVAKSAELADLAKVSDLAEIATVQDVRLARDTILGKLDTSLNVDTSELVKRSDLENLAAGRTLADLATPKDVNIQVNADGLNVPNAEEVADAVWNAESRTLTDLEGIDLSGLAKSEELEKLAKESTLQSLRQLLRSLPPEKRTVPGVNISQSLKR
ncbi:MAG: hypothetical protein IJV91_05730, partial [Kiritimatiellae bacterium]|nr:hypothetical protein [Kiritimatiellia bacterium]